MLSRLREGDSATVLSFDRLARSTKQLLSLSERFEEMDVDLISLKENVDTTTPQGKLVFRTFSAIAEFQRSIIKEAQREGIESAKAKGKIKGRPRVDPEKIEAALNLYRNKQMSVREIERTIGISRGTLYKTIREKGIVRGRESACKERSWLASCQTATGSSRNKCSHP